MTLRELILQEAELINFKETKIGKEKEEIGNDKTFTSFVPKEKLDTNEKETTSKKQETKDKKVSPKKDEKKECPDCKKEGKVCAKCKKLKEKEDEKKKSSSDSKKKPSCKTKTMKESIREHYDNIYSETSKEKNEEDNIEDETDEELEDKKLSKKEKKSKKIEDNVEDEDEEKTKTESIDYFDSVLQEENISFFKLSKKIDSFIRRANGAGEHMPNGGAVAKFDKFTNYMETLKTKAEELEKKYSDGTDKQKMSMKDDYKKLKLDAKKHMKLLKDSTGRWLWAITDDPKFAKVTKAIAVGFFALLGITLISGGAISLNSVNTKE